MEEARMSWRGSGNFRSSGNWKGEGGSGGSALGGGSAGGPPLIYMIAGVVAIGVIALIVVISVGMMSGGAQTAAAPQPTAAPAVATAAPAAVATAAPAAATAAPAAATAAPAAATAAPAAAATTAPTAAATTAPAAAGIPTAPFGSAVTTGSGEALAIGSDGELLAFDKTTLEVAAGKTYTLTFTNNSTAVQHNWVLLDGGSDVVNAAATAATAAQVKARNPLAAVPPADTPGLLVAMPIVNSGKTGEVTFKAPTKPGTYTFICTFPAHYIAATGTGMMGQLIVK
jgi:uncharacterized cupredoxin-like copper-binding protein